jgi:hypothetical protein
MMYSTAAAGEARTAQCVVRVTECPNCDSEVIAAADLFVNDLIEKAQYELLDRIEDESAVGLSTASLLLQGNVDSSLFLFADSATRWDGGPEEKAKR